MRTLRTRAERQALQLETIHIENFRALKDVTLPLSTFGCLIGENNAGKSSILHALHLVLTGNTPQNVDIHDHHDTSMPIRIELTISDISDGDLAQISDPGHRASFEADITDRTITLVRIVPPDGGKSSLKILKLGPVEDRFTDEQLTPIMKGKKNPDLRKAVVALLPELEPILIDKPSQTEIRAARDEIVAGLPATKMTFRDKPIGTGIDAAIKAFLPEPLYIEAVKDVATELKTSGTATFSKLLKILLDEVSDQFDGIEKQFEEIQRKLTRVLDESGNHIDNRLDQVKKIESTIEGFVRESFPDIDLKMTVPIPEIKTIVAGAELTADDGHEGSIASKGDGLKRAVTFAILRAYNVLRHEGLGDPKSKHTGGPSYLLLFEEPELYLYPWAQRQLFQALEAFAKDHSVLVTTHSPVFFSTGATKTFTKLRKISEAGSTPYTTITPVDLGTSLDARDAFQIIRHEHNEIAFFARAVVLVEGDSDAVVLPHLARLLDPTWNHIDRNIAFAQIGGKGNIEKYRTFFSHFDIPVHVVCDLDALISGFDKLTVTEDIVTVRQTLMSAVANSLTTPIPDITTKTAKSLAGSGDARSNWTKAKDAFESGARDSEAWAALCGAMDNFFTSHRKDEKLDALTGTDPDIARYKRELLEALRDENVHVLSRGDLEAYCGHAGLSKKVDKAVKFCQKVSSESSYRAVLGEQADDIVKELTTLFGRIFGESAAQPIPPSDRSKESPIEPVIMRPSFNTPQSVAEMTAPSQN
ncbi:AAA family ATPase [Rhodococcus opacus]|uniref:AAA family ATPase n=1 Tax=Rhodococcus opacus TaxID=37919 RepID=UPI0029499306|nr:AAA family ATPase [Rhodococcus opacus]MDV6247231.1 AAA family ATPase [Rhodococcus opacus]